MKVVNEMLKDIQDEDVNIQQIFSASGIKIYIAEKVKKDEEYINLIIDVFEEFLKERNITINKDENIEPSIIYGDDYFDLKKKIEKVLKR
jgi:hypothetical protein